MINEVHLEDLEAPDHYSLPSICFDETACPGATLQQNSPSLFTLPRKTYFKESGPSTTPYWLYSKNRVMHGYLILLQRVVRCSASALLAVQFQCQRPDFQALWNCCATSGTVKHSACTRAARQWCRFLRYLWWFSLPTLRAYDIHSQRRNFRETSDCKCGKVRKKNWAEVAPLNLKYPVPAEWQVKRSLD